MRHSTSRLCHKDLELDVFDIETRVNAKKNELENIGFRVGQRVALVGAGTSEWVLTYLALKSLELTVAPIDPDLDPETLLTKVNLIDPHFIIFLNHTKVDLTAYKKLSSLGQGGVIYKNKNSPELSPEDCSLMIFSSGTSGSEKVIMLSQQNLQTVIEIYEELVQKYALSNVLIVLPLSAIYPLAITLACLNTGRTVVLCDPKTEDMATVMKQHQIEVIPAVPLLIELIHDKIFTQLKANPLAYRVFSALLRLSGFVRRFLGYNLGKFIFAKAHVTFGKHFQLFLTGGASMSHRLLQDMYNLGFKVYEGYGLTETAGLVTYREDTPDSFGTVGKPIESIDLKLSKDNEILLKGPQLFMGYWRNAKETEKAFGNEGYFHTGDRGKLDEKGRLIITGRIKEMILLKDEKVYSPQQIESHYQDIEGVEEFCVVNVFDKNTSGDFLVLVVKKYPDTSEEEVYENIKARTAEVSALFKVHDIFFTNHIERTALSKIKRSLVRRQYEESRK